MFITFCIFAYNEEKYLRELLDCLTVQNYPHEKIEVLLIDSASEDRTKNIMKQFARINENGNGKNRYKGEIGFASVRVLDNPKRTQPCAWNVAIDNFSGEALLRVDAHSIIPANFISKNVEKLKQGEDVCGGPRHAITRQKDGFSKTLLLAEKSLFGAGIAQYRGRKKSTGEVKYVKSLFHAAFRREVFEKVGYYNEELIRTEDNDMNYRIRQAGFKLCYHEDIVSYQVIRPNLKKMMKQKFGNGYWIGRTLGVNPGCIQPFHLVPFAFVAASAAGAMIYKSVNNELAKKVLFKVWKLYGGLTVIMGLMAAYSNKNERDKTNIFLPIIFLMLHMSYGIGSVFGIASIPTINRQTNDVRGKVF